MSENADRVTQVPSVGRDVHHVARGSADGHYPLEIRPAKVTRVNDDGTVDLVVWTSEGSFWPRSVTADHGAPVDEVTYSPYYRCPQTGLAYRGGTWHWPPTVGPRR